MVGGLAVPQLRCVRVCAIPRLSLAVPHFGQRWLRRILAAGCLVLVGVNMPTCSELQKEAAAKKKEYDKADKKFHHADTKQVLNAMSDLGGILGSFICIAASAGTAVPCYIGIATLALKMAADADANQELDELRADRDQKKQDYEDAQREYAEHCFVADAGCGSRDGPGYRRPDGKCAAWSDSDRDEANA